jgi:hypothetical protein
MICRARDRFRDDHLMTTERCARELFDEFHDIAIRDHVGGEHLRRMCLEHSEQIAMLREEVAQSEKEGKRKNEE